MIDIPNGVSMDEAARILALDALRSASLWFTKVALDGDCSYQNGDDGRTDGKDAWDDAEEVQPKIDAAICALTSAMETK